NRLVSTSSRRRFAWMSTTAASARSAPCTALRGETSVKWFRSTSVFRIGPPTWREAASAYQDASISRPVTSSDISIRRLCLWVASLSRPPGTESSTSGAISSRTRPARRWASPGRAVTLAGMDNQNSLKLATSGLVISASARPGRPADAATGRHLGRHGQPEPPPPRHLRPGHQRKRPTGPAGRHYGEPPGPGRLETPRHQGLRQHLIRHSPHAHHTAAGRDRGRELIFRLRYEQEHDGCPRLLQRLEEGIGRLFRQGARLGDQEHGPCALDRGHRR